jgi:hypothetical protein
LAEKRGGSWLNSPQSAEKFNDGEVNVDGSQAADRPSEVGIFPNVPKKGIGVLEVIEIPSICPREDEQEQPYFQREQSETIAKNAVPPRWRRLMGLWNRV